MAARVAAGILKGRVVFATGALRGRRASSGRARFRFDGVFGADAEMNVACACGWTESADERTYGVARTAREFREGIICLTNGTAAITPAAARAAASTTRL